MSVHIEGTLLGANDGSDEHALKIMIGPVSEADGRALMQHLKGAIPEFLKSVGAVGQDSKVKTVIDTTTRHQH